MPIDFSNPSYVIAAVLAGPTLSGALVAWMTYRFGRLAQRATVAAAERAVQVAADNKTNQTRAQSEAALAQKGVIEAAERLVVVARGTDTKLADVVKAAETTDNRLVELQKTASGTHVLVNGKRSAMLREIADLRRRVATEHPRDKSAQKAALKAEADATINSA